ncbi:hypothetical protein IKF88_01600 [Candidatus Saccharibacteria bacterium]|nr:hypothetical protein [Candidatus Saccharibacteria bacterium]
MKEYFADLLTLIRFIISIVLIILAVFNSQADIGTGFLLFAIAELTDAFDGTCAARWPFPKNKTPKYRKYAAQYDMYADALTAIATILFFILRVNLVAGLIITISYGIIALAVEAIAYGRLFGHPDNCTPNSLTKRNFKLAKKIILARRMLYIALIALVTFWLLYASNWLFTVKIAITVVVLIIGVFLWIFLSQRRHNISRDAVHIEKELSK